MAATAPPPTGYLLLADISGYTSFLTGTEMDHAQAIMEEVIARILTHVQPPLQLVKLEGDAVFCYVPGAALPDTERLMEAVETCYVDFRDHLLNMHRSTTCQCGACQAIPSLDLKFLLHYGTYLIQRLAGTTDLAGPDVILVHRLLKNHIVEETGRPAYLFMTDACLARLARPLDLPRYSDTYEHLGAVSGQVLDLRAVWEARVAARRTYITPEEADWQLEVLLPAPPAVAWQYMVDPTKAVHWRAQTTVEVRPTAEGRIAAGAALHCAHGSLALLHEFIDWRPFQYYTELGRKVSPGFAPHGYSPWNLTVELIPQGPGATLLQARGRWVLRTGWRAALRGMISPRVAQENTAMFRRLAAMLAAEAANFTPDP